MSKTSEDSIRCSFCGREKKEVNVLIAGITGHICDSCITQAHLIVKEEGGVKSKNEIENMDNEISELIETGLEKAYSATEPSYEQLFTDVYVDYKGH